MFARLPEGYRPHKTMEFMVPRNTISFGIINIKTDGYIQITGAAFDTSAAIALMGTTKCEIRYNVFKASV